MKVRTNVFYILLLELAPPDARPATQQEAEDKEKE